MNTRTERNRGWEGRDEGCRHSEVLGAYEDIRRFVPYTKIGEAKI